MSQSHGENAQQRRPDLSVIIANYNYADYIPLAIASLQRQRGPTLEVIVVDDGSTDNSREVVAGLIADDPRIRLYGNESKKGVSGARNTGLKYATGEWLMFLDADDMVFDGSLAALFAMIERNPDCRFVAGDICKVDPDGARVDAPQFLSDEAVVAALEPYAIAGGYRIPDPVRFFFAVRFLVLMGNAVLHRDLVARIGPFDEAMTHAEDTDFDARAARLEKLYFIAEPVLQYRQHDRSVSTMTERKAEGTVSFARKLYADPDFAAYRSVTAGYLLRALDAAIVYQREHGNFAAARRHAWAAQRLAPMRARSWKHVLASLLHKP